MGLETILIASALAASAGASVYSTREARKTAKEQKDELERQRIEAEEAKAEIEGIEKERAKRLAARGSTLPDTILSGGTFSGLKTPPPISRTKLLGA